jgi:hypothetical protein
MRVIERIKEWFLWKVKRIRRVNFYVT